MVLWTWILVKNTRAPRPIPSVHVCVSIPSFYYLWYFLLLLDHFFLPLNTWISGIIIFDQWRLAYISTPLLTQDKYINLSLLPPSLLPCVTVAPSLSSPFSLCFWGCPHCLFDMLNYWDKILAAQCIKIIVWTSS